MWQDRCSVVFGVFFKALGAGKVVALAKIAEKPFPVAEGRRFEVAGQGKSL